MADKKLLDDLRDTFAAAAVANALSDVRQRKMFGCDAFFRRDVIFGLIWKAGRIGVKIPTSELFEKARGMPGFEPWTAGNRTMAHWLLLPEAIHQDAAELERWIVRAHALAGAGPVVRGKEKESKTSGTRRADSASGRRAGAPRSKKPKRRG